MTIKSVGLLLASLLLSACATPPMFHGMQKSAGAGSEHQLTRSALVDATSASRKHLDLDKNIVYEQTSGGSAALGIALGPIGALGNMAMIEKITTAEAALLYGKIDIKPHAMFFEAAAKEGLLLSEAQNSVKLTPYLYISKVENDKLIVIAALWAQYQVPSSTLWKARYFYQLPQTYTVSELSTLDAERSSQLREAARHGFALLAKQLQSDQQPVAVPEQAIIYTAKIMFDNVLITVPGSLISDDGELVWFRGWGGVFGLRRPTVTYTRAEK